MFLGVGLLGTFCVCGIILMQLIKKEKEKDKWIPKRSDVLYYSSNRNSYSKARDVFQTLKDAEITPNFLGGKHE